MALPKMKIVIYSAHFIPKLYDRLYSEPKKEGIWIIFKQIGSIIFI